MSLTVLPLRRMSITPLTLFILIILRYSYICLFYLLLHHYYLIKIPVYCTALVLLTSTLFCMTLLLHTMIVLHGSSARNISSKFQHPAAPNIKSSSVQLLLRDSHYHVFFVFTIFIVLGMNDNQRYAF